MTRKLVYFFIMISVVGCLFFFNCSGGGKYGEVKKLLNDYIALSKKLEADIDNANDGKAFAKALTEYFKKVKDLSPQLEALPEKYPELENDPPEELEDIVSEFESSMAVMGKVMEKAMKYLDDPDVMKALEEMDSL